MEKNTNQAAMLAELQKIELELLKKVAAVCEKNEIEYYLGFGTLLGAVRHKGFIPWDDDVDIFMTRKNAEKFLSLPASELPSHVGIKTYSNNPNGSRDIKLQPKVETTEKKVIRQIGGKKTTQNIWIDIFIIDGMPNAKFSRKMHYYNLQFHHILCRMARSAKNGTSDSKKRGTLESAAVNFLKVVPVGKLLNPVKCMKSTDKVLESCHLEKCDWAITFAPDYGMKCIVPAKCFKKKVKMKFEDGEFWAPAGYDYLLKHWYGDYMTPPPVEKRVAKHIAGVID